MTCSVSGSISRNVGSPSAGNFSTTSRFFSASVSTASQTTASFAGRRPASGKTNERIDRQEWHQVAQLSRNSGFFSAFAFARAPR